MAKGRPFVVDESFLETTPWHDRRAADALAAAIRKPLDALESAAREAEKGMLGPAKLALLVATTHLIDALEAVDHEFARRSTPRTAASSTRPADQQADARDA